MRLHALAFLLFGSLVLAGCAQPAPGDRLTQDPDGTDPATSTTTTAARCVEGRWHVTAAIHLPAEPEGSGPDTPRRVDFAAPQAADGGPYYDFANSARFGGTNRQTLAFHMHIDTSNPETGDLEVAVAQWHLEQPEACISVQAALGQLDVVATATSLALSGGHTQVAGQSGRFEATGERELRWFVAEAARGWAWREVSWDEVRGRQMLDGESLLVALGDYSEAQVRAMQDAVPPPISRPR